MSISFNLRWPKFPNKLYPKFKLSSDSTGKRLVFVFSARGSHWRGMGRQLYKESLIFRETIRRSDIVIKEMLGWSLVKRYEGELSGEDLNPVDEEEFIEPEVVALQLALTEVWRKHGVLPDAVAGLSGGEFAAAHAAGALTLRDTMKIACAVSLMIRQRRGLGNMLLVQFDSKQLTSLLEEINQPLYITAIYNPVTSIVSGNNESIEKFTRHLEEKAIVHFPIPTDFAFHSPLVDEWKEPFLQLINEIHPLYTAIPIYSSSSKRKLETKVEIMHWWEVVRKTALFNEAIESLLDQGYDNFIEISPHPIVTDSILQLSRDMGKKVTVHPTMCRNENEAATMDSTLKHLKEQGYKLKLPSKSENPKAPIKKRHVDLKSLGKENVEKKPPQFDLFSPKIKANPYPYYEQLRNDAPVNYFSNQGCWIVSRYDDVSHILKSPKQFSSETMAKFDPSLLGANPPDHTRVRKIVSQLFSQQYLSEIKDDIRNLSQQLISKMVPGKKWDVIDELAGPLPLKVIMKILGADEGYQQEFQRWSHANVVSATGVVDIAELPIIEKDKAECKLFLQKHIQYCQQNPGSSAFSDLLHGKNGNGSLTVNEAIDFSQLLLIAGNETTTNLIGNTLLVLLKYPDLINEVRNNKELIPSLVEEVLRYDTPVQFVQRIVTEDLELSSISIPRGARVIALLGSANRDPLHFEHPDQFILIRNSKDHLAFGTGVHFCLGAQLARMQTIIVLQELLTQLPDFRIMQSLDEIEFVNSIQLRGPKHFWITSDAN